MELERENFYRIITLILKVGTKCLRELLEHFLRTENITLQGLLSQYQHELYHLHFNSVKCCRCSNNEFLSRKRILNQSQLEILYSVNSTRPQYGQARCNTSGFCCCQLSANLLSSDSLDLTLSKCLLINCCQKLFVDSFLQGQSFEDYLNKNIHDIYHAWQPNRKCCRCPSGLCTNTSGKQTITDKLWTTLYGVNSSTNFCPKCGCACSLAAIKGIAWKHLNRYMATAFIGAFCHLRRTLEELAEHRNIVYGHALDVAISNDLFDEKWSQIKTCIVDLSAVFTREVRLDIEKEIELIKTGPLNERSHKQYHTIMLEEMRNNVDMKEEILFHLKLTTEQIKGSQTNVGRSIDTLSNKLDSLLNKQEREIQSRAIQTVEDAMGQTDMASEFQIKLTDKQESLKALDVKINDLQQYKATYQSKTSNMRQEIQNQSKCLQAAIIAKERELIQAIEHKETDALDKITSQIGTMKTLRGNNEKRLSNYTRMIKTIGDDREMLDQFIQDSMPTLDAMSIDQDVEYPTSLTYKCGQAGQLDFGYLKEDTSLGSKQKPLYLDELKIRRKFKVELPEEEENTSVYTVCIRPDGNLWLTTMAYKIILADRSGRIIASKKLPFTIFYTQCNKNGVLYCSSGRKIYTASFNGDDQNGGKITVTEFENMTPFYADGIHINGSGQCLVLLSNENTVKVAFFSPEGMILNEIDFDFEQLSIEEELLFITQNSADEIFLSRPQTLVRFDVAGKNTVNNLTIYHPEDGLWEGKRITVDQYDNIISSEGHSDDGLKINVTNREGNVIKIFHIGVFNACSINGLAVDCSEQNPLLWITTTGGHVIAAEFLNTED